MWHADFASDLIEPMTNLRAVSRSRFVSSGWAIKSQRSHHLLGILTTVFCESHLSMLLVTKLALSGPSYSSTFHLHHKSTLKPPSSSSSSSSTFVIVTFAKPRSHQDEMVHCDRSGQARLTRRI